MAANAPALTTSPAEPEVKPRASEPVDKIDPAQSHLQQELAGFLSARAELASIEAKEAAEHTAKKIANAIILALCAFFTWSLLLASITGFLAPFANQWLGDKSDSIPGWALILLILGLLHGIAALLFFKKLKEKPATPLFELTLKEIELDKQWLTKNK